MATPGPTSPRRNGPPRKDGPGLVIGVRCQPKLLNAIDSFRSGTELTRPAALRELAQIALAIPGALNPSPRQDRAPRRIA
jgi:hypothetical protein